MVLLLRKVTGVRTEDIEDAVADAALKIVVANKPAVHLRALLFKSALNLIAGRERQSSRRPLHLPIETSLRDDSKPPPKEAAVYSSFGDPLAHAERAEEASLLSEKLTTHLGKLVPRSRLAVERYLLEGASIDDVARDINVSGRGASVIVYRAKRKLKRLLSEGPDKIEHSR